MRNMSKKTRKRYDRWKAFRYGDYIYIGKHEREALNTILRPISFTKVAFIEVN